MPNFLQAAVDYTDLGFNPEALKNMNISIQLRLDGFSFAIIDIFDKRLLKLQDYKTTTIPKNSIQEKWEEVIKSFKIFIKQSIFELNSFNKTIFIIDHNEYTLMPKALFIEAKAKDYLIFNQNISYSFDIFSNTIFTTDKVILFAVYQPLKTIIDERFSEYSLKHHNNVLLLALLKLQKNKKTTPSLYVSVSSNLIHIIGIDNENLLMCNTYQFSSKEDFIYFVLLAYDQLSLNPKKDSLYLLGDISRSSLIFQICWQYILNISFIDQLSGIKTASAFDHMPTHQYFTLIQSTLCE